MFLAALAPVAITVSPQALVSEAHHAIDAGRVDQARLLIARAVAIGAGGLHLERALADVAYESGKYQEAATRYEVLANSPTADTAVIERTGISALRAGDVERSASWITKAVGRSDASWEAWNALGVLADLRREYHAADAAYARGLEIAPSNAILANNKGWSLLMRGAWEEAVTFLEEAAATESPAIRIRNNLELAKAALDQDLPRRRSGEDDESWAARLNDVGVLAHSKGQKGRAIAAFAQAVDARNVWFKRAADNLRMAEESQ